MSTININHLSFGFGDQQILQDITTTFEPNTIYGLLGANGAGKSTLMNLINNRLLAPANTISLDSRNLTTDADALHHLFLTSEANLYPKEMTIKKILGWMAHFYGDFDSAFAEKLLHAFELKPKQKFGKLSTGYRSIFKAIIALCVPCDFVFLDEPTLGLDASHRDLFYQALMTTCAKRPRTFVIATHIIDEVATLLEEVKIVKDGRLIRDMPLDDLLANTALLSGPAEAVQQAIGQATVLSTTSTGAMQQVAVQGAYVTPLPLNVTKQGLTLQQLFVALTATADLADLEVVSDAD